MWPIQYLPILGKSISIAFLTHGSSVCLAWKVFGARDLFCYINVYHIPDLYFQPLIASLNAVSTGIIAHPVVYVKTINSIDKILYFINPQLNT